MWPPAAWKWEAFAADADDLYARLHAALASGEEAPWCLGRAAVVAAVAAWEVYVKSLALDIVALQIAQEDAALGDLNTVERLVDGKQGGLNVPWFADVRTLMRAAFGVPPNEDNWDDPLWKLVPLEYELDAVIQRRHDIVHGPRDDCGHPADEPVPIAESEAHRAVVIVRQMVEGLENAVKTALSLD
jgi:hypothetical protein